MSNSGDAADQTSLGVVQHALGLAWLNIIAGNFTQSA